MRTLWISALALVPAVLAAQTQDPGQPSPAVSESVVVSATRGPEIETEIPGQATVITGDELRRENVKTVADALQDVVGLDTGTGSDNGGRQPNVGLWGLKEFDALLFMVDGVPVGGPFNPSLSQINIEDVDRIEIVKGPQGTLYGVSGFAGMIQIFTKGASEGTHASVSGGSFSDGRVDASTNFKLGASKVRLFGNLERSKGWQDRTDFKDDRGGFRIDNPLPGGGNLAVIFDAYRNTQFFGSPLPVDPPSGETIEGFRVDRNYEVGGARLDHRLYSLTADFEKPISKNFTIQNTLSYTHDDQISVRSFVDAGSVSDNTVDSSGVALKPTEKDFYEDLHFTANFEAAGHHRLVGGAALTWGRTVASGEGFDFTLQLDPVAVPNLSDIPAGDHRSFVDRRTFFGVYANDEWTPIDALTITAGARFDSVSESLFAKGQEVGDPEADVSRDSRSDGQWSGGIAALARLIGDRAGAVNEINLYAAAKSAFKPAAPNLTEAESATILQPERTRSGEIGVKTRWLDHQLSFDLSLFHMIFENLVVSTVGARRQPGAGQRGQGALPGHGARGGLPSGGAARLFLSRGLRPPRRAVRPVHVHRSGRGPAGRLRPGARADAPGPLECESRLSPDARPRGLGGGAAPEPPPVRQDQHRVHAVVLRMGRGRFVGLQSRRAALARRKEPRRQPALRGRKRNRRRAELRGSPTEVPRGAERSLLTRAAARS